MSFYKYGIAFNYPFPFHGTAANLINSNLCLYDLIFALLYHQSTPFFQLDLPAHTHFFCTICCGCCCLQTFVVIFSFCYNRPMTLLGCFRELWIGIVDAMKDTITHAPRVSTRTRTCTYTRSHPSAIVSNKNCFFYSADIWPASTHHPSG